MRKKIDMDKREKSHNLIDTCSFDDAFQKMHENFLVNLKQIRQKLEIKGIKSKLKTNNNCAENQKRGKKVRKN